MPPPAIYILAVVGTIAAGVAFKEFVYEPHIAPKIEQWAEEFLAKRQARRRQRSGAVAVAASRRGHTDENPSRRRGKLSDSVDEERRSIELENLIAKEVREWRSEVDRSQVQKLRHRNNAAPSSSRNVLDESTHDIPFVPISPTHIVYDSSEPSTPTSTLPSRASSISARVSFLREAPSNSTLRSPLHVDSELQDPISDSLVGIVPAGTASPIPSLAVRSPSAIPSLSQSFPQELDYEHGLELLSAPSSRPDTPFSSFSQPLAANEIIPSNSPHYSLSPLSLLHRVPSRSLSDLDYLSDLDEPHHDVMSPRSSIDDGIRSNMSDSSWASADAHGSH